MRPYKVNTLQGFQVLRELGLTCSCGILMSYYYYRDIDLFDLFKYYFDNENDYPQLFIDSGAFQALSFGGTIALSDYAEWLKRYAKLISVFSNLDVIMNAEETEANQNALEEIGLSPLPCFHVLEPFEILQQQLSKYSYIGLGVAGMTRRKNGVIAFLSRCFKMASMSPIYHGFAMTSLDFMQRFHFRSIDSSTWSNVLRFGSLQLFDRRRNKFVGFQLPKYGMKREQEEYVYGVLHRDYEPFFKTMFDQNSFDGENMKRPLVSALAMRSFHYAQEFLREYHNDPDFIIYLSEVTK